MIYRAENTESKLSIDAMLRYTDTHRWANIVFRIHIYNYSNRTSHFRLEELITRLVKNKKIRWLSFAQEIPSIHLARIPRDARESPSESQSRRCTRYDSSHEHTANSPSWKIPITSSRGIFIFSNTSALFLFPQSPPFFSLSLSPFFRIHFAILSSRIQSELVENFNTFVERIVGNSSHPCRALFWIEQWFRYSINFYNCINTFRNIIFVKYL